MSKLKTLVALAIFTTGFGFALEDSTIATLGRYPVNSAEFKNRLIDYLQTMNLSGSDTTIEDDTQLIFGTSSDWSIQYDETTDNRLEIVGTATPLLIDTSGAGVDITLSTDGADGDDLLITAGNLTASTTAVATVNGTTLTTDGAFKASSTSALVGAVTVSADITSDEAGTFTLNSKTGQALSVKGGDGAGASDDVLVDGSNIDVDASGNLTFIGVAKAGSGGVQITDATGNLDGEQLIADSVDDDSIDFDASLASETADAVSLYDFGLIRGTASAAGGLADPANGAFVSLDITVGGVAAGDYVMCSCSEAITADEGTFSYYVSAPNTVTILYLDDVTVATHPDVDGGTATWNCVAFLE